MPKQKLNPVSNNFDFVSNESELVAELDDQYLRLDGGNEATSAVDLADKGFLITDSNGVQYRVTVNTDGALVTTRITADSGTPFGPLLWLTYS